MCPPVIALAGLAVSAASTVTGFMGQQQAAAQQNAVKEANDKAALQAYQDTTRAQNEQQSQTMEAAAAQKFDNALQARAARATNMVAAGENGISGHTVASLVGSIYGEEARAGDRIDQQTDWTMQQLQAEKSGAGAKYVARVNSVERANKPSFMNLGLSIAKNGLDAYSKYREETEKQSF